MPILAHIAEQSVVLGDEFREGNDNPVSRNLEIIKHSVSQLPKGKRITKKVLLGKLFIR